MIGWYSMDEWNDGRAQFEADHARAQEDEARAAESAAAEAEARAKEEAPEPIRAFVPGDRVELMHERGSLLLFNLGKIVKISANGYVQVQWDDNTDGWFSPAKAYSALRLARGDDALPRHVWIFSADASNGWEGPTPTEDEPACAVCREKQTDDNEYGPCRKP